MEHLEIRDNGDRMDAIVADLGHVSGVLQMLVNLNQSRLGRDGTGGNALEDVAGQDTEGLDWVLNEALDRVRRAKGLAREIHQAG